MEIEELDERLRILHTKVEAERHWPTKRKLRAQLLELQQQRKRMNEEEDSYGE